VPELGTRRTSKTLSDGIERDYQNCSK
jgi:hypothetical protein